MPGKKSTTEKVKKDNIEKRVKNFQHIYNIRDKKWCWGKICPVDISYRV